MSTTLATADAVEHLSWIQGCQVCCNSLADTSGFGNVNYAFEYTGVRVDDEQELPGQDGAQGRADLPGFALHRGRFSLDGIRHGPQGLPDVIPERRRISIPRAILQRVPLLLLLFRQC